MDFHNMKRKDLQSLCKKHGIPANISSAEMAHKLASILQPKSKEVDDEDNSENKKIRGCLRNSGGSVENLSGEARGTGGKKVSFSLESEKLVEKEDLGVEKRRSSRRNRLVDGDDVAESVGVEVGNLVEKRRSSRRTRSAEDDDVAESVGVEAGNLVEKGDLVGEKKRSSRRTRSAAEDDVEGSVSVDAGNFVGKGELVLEAKRTSQRTRSVDDVEDVAESAEVEVGVRGLRSRTIKPAVVLSPVGDKKRKGAKRTESVCENVESDVNVAEKKRKPPQRKGDVKGSEAESEEAGKVVSENVVAGGRATRSRSVVVGDEKPARVTRGAKSKVSEAVDVVASVDLGAQEVNVKGKEVDSKEAGEEVSRNVEAGGRVTRTRSVAFGNEMPARVTRGAKSKGSEAVAGDVGDIMDLGTQKVEKDDKTEKLGRRKRPCTAVPRLQEVEDSEPCQEPQRRLKRSHAQLVNSSLVSDAEAPIIIDEVKKSRKLDKDTTASSVAECRVVVRRSGRHASADSEISLPSVFESQEVKAEIKAKKPQKKVAKNATVPDSTTLCMDNDLALSETFSDDVKESLTVEELPRRSTRRYNVVSTKEHASSVQDVGMAVQEGALEQSKPTTHKGRKGKGRGAALKIMDETKTPVAQEQSKPDTHKGLKGKGRDATLKTKDETETPVIVEQLVASSSQELKHSSCQASGNNTAKQLNVSPIGGNSQARFHLPATTYSLGTSTKELKESPASQEKHTSEDLEEPSAYLKASGIEFPTPATTNSLLMSTNDLKEIQVPLGKLILEDREQPSVEHMTLDSVSPMIFPQNELINKSPEVGIPSLESANISVSATSGQKESHDHLKKQAMRSPGDVSIADCTTVSHISDSAMGFSKEISNSTPLSGHNLLSIECFERQLNQTQQTCDSSEKNQGVQSIGCIGIPSLESAKFSVIATSGQKESHDHLKKQAMRSPGNISIADCTTVGHIYDSAMGFSKEISNSTPLSVHNLLSIECFERQLNQTQQICDSSEKNQGVQSIGCISSPAGESTICQTALANSSPVITNSELFTVAQCNDPEVVDRCTPEFQECEEVKRSLAENRDIHDQFVESGFTQGVDEQNAENSITDTNDSNQHLDSAELSSEDLGHVGVDDEYNNSANKTKCRKSLYGEDCFEASPKSCNPKSETDISFSCNNVEEPIAVVSVASPNTISKTGVEPEPDLVDEKFASLTPAYIGNTNFEDNSASEVMNHQKLVNSKFGSLGAADAKLGVDDPCEEFCTVEEANGSDMEINDLMTHEHTPRHASVDSAESPATTLLSKVDDKEYFHKGTKSPTPVVLALGASLAEQGQFSEVPVADEINPEVSLGNIISGPFLDDDKGGDCANLKMNDGDNSASKLNIVAGVGEMAKSSTAEINSDDNVTESAYVHGSKFAGYEIGPWLLTNDDKHLGAQTIGKRSPKSAIKENEDEEANNREHNDAYVKFAGSSYDDTIDADILDGLSDCTKSLEKSSENDDEFFCEADAEFVQYQDMPSLYHTSKESEISNDIVETPGVEHSGQVSIEPRTVDTKTMNTSVGSASGKPEVSGISLEMKASSFTDYYKEEHVQNVAEISASKVEETVLNRTSSPKIGESSVYSSQVVNESSLANAEPNACSSINKDTLKKPHHTMNRMETVETMEDNVGEKDGSLDSFVSIEKICPGTNEDCSTETCRNSPEVILTNRAQENVGGNLATDRVSDAKLKLVSDSSVLSDSPFYLGELFTVENDTKFAAKVPLSSPVFSGDLFDAENEKKIVSKDCTPEPLHYSKESPMIDASFSVSIESFEQEGSFHLARSCHQTDHGESGTKSVAKVPLGSPIFSRDLFQLENEREFVSKECHADNKHGLEIDASAFLVRSATAIQELPESCITSKPQEQPDFATVEGAAKPNKDPESESHHLVSLEEGSPFPLARSCHNTDREENVTKSVAKVPLEHETKSAAKVPLENETKSVAEDCPSADHKHGLEIDASAFSVGSASTIQELPKSGAPSHLARVGHMNHKENETKFVAKVPMGSPIYLGDLFDLENETKSVAEDCPSADHKPGLEIDASAFSVGSVSTIRELPKSAGEPQVQLDIITVEDLTKPNKVHESHHCSEESEMIDASFSAGAKCSRQEGSPFHLARSCHKTDHKENEIKFVAKVPLGSPTYLGDLFDLENETNSVAEDCPSADHKHGLEIDASDFSVGSASTIQELPTSGVSSKPQEQHDFVTVEDLTKPNEAPESHHCTEENETIDASFSAGSKCSGGQEDCPFHLARSCHKFDNEENITKIVAKVPLGSPIFLGDLFDMENEPKSVAEDCPSADHKHGLEIDASAFSSGSANSIQELPKSGISNKPLEQQDFVTVEDLTKPNEAPESHHCSEESEMIDASFSAGAKCFGQEGSPIHLARSWHKNDHEENKAKFVAKVPLGSPIYLGDLFDLENETNSVAEDCPSADHKYGLDIDASDFSVGSASTIQEFPKSGISNKPQEQHDFVTVGDLTKPNEAPESHHCSEDSETIDASFSAGAKCLGGQEGSPFHLARSCHKFDHEENVTKFVAKVPLGSPIFLGDLFDMANETKSVAEDCPSTDHKHGRKIDASDFSVGSASTIQELPKSGISNKPQEQHDFVTVEDLTKPNEAPESHQCSEESEMIDTSISAGAKCFGQEGSPIHLARSCHKNDHEESKAKFVANVPSASPIYLGDLFDLENETKSVAKDCPPADHKHGLEIDASAFSEGSATTIQQLPNRITSKPQELPDFIAVEGLTKPNEASEPHHCSEESKMIDTSSSISIESCEQEGSAFHLTGSCHRTDHGEKEVDYVMLCPTSPVPIQSFHRTPIDSNVKTNSSTLFSADALITDNLMKGDLEYCELSTAKVEFSTLNTSEVGNVICTSETEDQVTEENFFQRDADTHSTEVVVGQSCSEMALDTDNELRKDLFTQTKTTLLQLDRVDAANSELVACPDAAVSEHNISNKKEEILQKQNPGNDSYLVPTEFTQVSQQKEDRLGDSYSVLMTPMRPKSYSVQGKENSDFRKREPANRVDPEKSAISARRPLQNVNSKTGR